MEDGYSNLNLESTGSLSRGGMATTSRTGPVKKIIGERNRCQKELQKAPFIFG